MAFDLKAVAHEFALFLLCKKQVNYLVMRKYYIPRISFSFVSKTTLGEPKR